MGSIKLISKSDFEPLLPGGVHSLTMEEFEGLTVGRFPENERRRMLFRTFRHWHDALHRRGVSGRLWMCGSFLTTKEDPGDVDLILWAPKVSNPMADHGDMPKLLDPVTVFKSFKVDIHVEPFDNDYMFFREAHYLGIYGFANDRRTARGIAEIIIGD